MNLTFALIASVLAIVGNIPYIYKVIKGSVRPHPYTWLVGSIVSCIVFFGQLAGGAGVGAIPTLAAEIFTVVIFLLSLRYGFRGITRTDTLFLCIALLSIIPWMLTKDPTLSVIMAVGIDLVSFIPTLRKTWHIPSSEHWILYGMNVVRHVFMLLALEAHNIATTLHSIVMIVLNTVMVGIVVMRTRK